MLLNETTTLLVSLKTKFLTLLTGAIALLTPIKYLMVLVGVFIAIDTFFGIWAAKKTGKKLTSRRFSSFIGKIILYNSAVILTFALDKLILGEFLLYLVNIEMVATKIVVLALITNELFSVDEKLKLVNSEKGLWYHFKRLLGLAKKFKAVREELEDDDK